MRANERTDERVAQYGSLYSWLLSTIVRQSGNPAPEAEILTPVNAFLLRYAVQVIGEKGTWGKGRGFTVYLRAVVLNKMKAGDTL